MTTNTNERISAALDHDDHAFLASLDADRGMFQQLGDSMNGPLGWWAQVCDGVRLRHRHSALPTASFALSPPKAPMPFSAGA